jgi:hypothetical protein
MALFDSLLAESLSLLAASIKALPVRLAAFRRSAAGRPELLSRSWRATERACKAQVFALLSPHMPRICCSACSKETRLFDARSKTSTMVCTFAFIAHYPLNRFALQAKAFSPREMEKARTFFLRVELNEERVI